MTLLDWLLVLLVGAYALSGYWQGFVTGAFATVGLILGGLLGVWLAPMALGEAAPSVWVSLAALFIVILSASLGQAVLQYVGGRIRDRITWQPIKAVDAVGGAALSAAAVLLVAWALGVAISGTRLGGVTAMVRNSVVLAKVDQALPEGADTVLRSFDDVVGTTFFPRYLEPFAPERIIEVGPGPQRMLRDPDVLAAESGVVKVRGVNKCGSGLEGSGFAYAPGVVMTNAHVVAGVSEPTIATEQGDLDATVVVYDADLDVAVLRVDGLAAEPLAFAGPAEARQAIAVVGFPQDGPIDFQTGRVRAEQRLRSPNIYGRGTVIRDVLSLRTVIRPGNSGGPVLDSSGEVLGVVFAASVTDPQTGYALTSSQVEEAAAVGLARTQPTSTGPCAG